MLEKYNKFAYSLSAPEKCQHCGQPTQTHNYYPHFVAVAAISSVVTLLAFAVPLLMWAQTNNDLNNTSSTPATSTLNQMPRPKIEPLKKFPVLNANQIKTLAQSLKSDAALLKQKMTVWRGQGFVAPTSTKESLEKLKVFLNQNGSATKIKNMSTSTVIEMQKLHDKFTQEQKKAELLKEWEVNRGQVKKATETLDRLVKKMKAMSQPNDLKNANLNSQIQILEEALTKLKQLQPTPSSATPPVTNNASF